MKKGRTILGIIIAALLLAAGAYKIFTNQKKTDEETKIIAGGNAEVPVNITTVEMEDIKSQYSANGTLAPYQQVQLSSEISGKVTQVLVKEGDYVEKGQSLATIKKDALEVSYSNAQSAYQNAIEDNQRFENAYKSGGVTKQQLDQSRLQLQNAKNNLRQAELQVGDANVKTLISGYVNQKSTEAGAVVAPGTPLFDIVNVSQLKLKVNVGESQVTRINTGDTVTVKMSVYPDREFTGKVSFVAPAGDLSLNYPVEVIIDNPEANEQKESVLRSGMYGTVYFSNGNKNGKNSYLIVPKEAFVDGISSGQVFVVQDDDTVKLTDVNIGQVFGDKVQVLHGLEEGTKVVTSGQINLIDGAKISIID